MIYANHREIYSIFMQNKAVQAVYFGVHLVWQAIRSCFGAGYWHNDYPWKNEDCWKNN